MRANLVRDVLQSHPLAGEGQPERSLVWFALRYTLDKGTFGSGVYGPTVPGLLKKVLPFFERRSYPYPGEVTSPGTAPLLFVLGLIFRLLSVCQYAIPSRAAALVLFHTPDSLRQPSLEEGVTRPALPRSNS